MWVNFYLFLGLNNKIVIDEEQLKNALIADQNQLYLIIKRVKHRSLDQDLSHISGVNLVSKLNYMDYYIYLFQSLENRDLLRTLGLWNIYIFPWTISSFLLTLYSFHENNYSLSGVSLFSWNFKIVFSQQTVIILKKHSNIENMIII